VVAVWAGSGIEGTWEDGAEDDVGVAAARRERLVLAMIGEHEGSDSKTYKLTIIGEIP
jgi:hypothetical protein